MDINMKKIFYSLAACLLAIGFTACSDDNDALTDTTLTHYVAFELNGGDFIEIPLGEPFEDPGFSADLNGEDYTSRVTVDGLEDIDVNSLGLYEVTYSAVSPDGYPSSVTRTVAVCDPTVTTNIEGEYLTGEGTTIQAGSTVIPLLGFKITIKKVATGIFSISDMIAGFYDQRAGYGPRYALTGYLSADNNNNIDVISAIVPGWGDSYEYFENGSYNPVNRKVTFDVGYYVYDFHVVLNFNKPLE